MHTCLMIDIHKLTFADYADLGLEIVVPARRGRWIGDVQLFHISNKLQRTSDFCAENWLDLRVEAHKFPVYYSLHNHHLVSDLFHHHYACRAVPTYSHGPDALHVHNCSKILNDQDSDPFLLPL